MPESLNAFLTEHPVALLFVILGFGYLIGKVKIAGFELGAVSGVLFVGLVFGHFGYTMSPTAQTFGFLLFIFSVGFQAGPRFFGILRQDGLRYFLLALVIGATGLGVAWLMARLMGFEFGAAAGMLAGGLTSSPTLAAAQEAVRAGQVPVPDGYTADAVMTNVTTAYAITYIFGLIGLIVIIQVLPKLVGVDLRAEADKLASDDGGGLEDAAQTFGDLVARAYRVERPDACGVPLREMAKRRPGEAMIEKIRRGGEWIDVDDETCLELGDEVCVVTLREYVVRGPEVLGPELTDPELVEHTIESCRIVVTNRSLKGHVVDPYRVTLRFGVFLSHIKRMGVDVPFRGQQAELMPGDVLHVTGTPRRLDAVGALVGHVERDVEETDLVTLAFGVAAGSFVGALTVEIGGIPIGLGAAGGLLTAGLVIGYLRAIHPTFGRMPSAARWLFMELGLLMFMAGVGVRAGSKILETLANSGAALFLSGALVTVLPILVGYFVGTKVLRIHPVLLFGGITGSMTSGASLSLVLRAAGNSMPALGYTGAYAFANILLTIAGSIILLL